MVGFLKPAPFVIVVYRQSAAATGAHDQILPAIAIEILPADSRSQPAEPTRQQRLPGPIVEGFLGMGMLD
jgi:hypothetical protein